MPKYNPNLFQILARHTFKWSPSTWVAEHGRGGYGVLKVLIAEDDLMIADMAEDILVAHGYEVCGIARTVAEAVELGLAHRPDFAIIDLRLANGGLGTDIVAQLGAVGQLGVLYATGNVAQVILTAADGHACLAKPYGPADLLRGLQIVSDLFSTGTAATPFPRGLQLLHPATDQDGDPHYGWERLDKS